MSRARGIPELIFLLLVISLFCQVGWGQPWEGNGVEGDPYLIYTPEDMQAIGADPNYWDAHFKLMADIDLSAYTGTSFNIIGTYPSNPFTGVFDGNDRTISNFTYNSNGVSYIGLFGYVDDANAEIKDLGLIDPNVNAGTGWRVGSLVGRVGDATVSACYVDGASVSGHSIVGGLVGSNSGTIRHCYSTGGVSASRGEPFAYGNGGLVGGNCGTQGGGMYGSECSSILKDCVFSGNSADYGGGIYNIVYESAGGLAAVNCVFTGNEAEYHGGGIYNYLSSPTVTNCTFSGNEGGVRGGGMYNYLGSCPVITNCILWGDTAGIEGAEIHNFTYSEATVTYSCVEGGYTGTGNTSGDPEFASQSTPPDADGSDGMFMTDDDGLRLATGSSCIDAANGDGDATPTMDILSYARIDIAGISGGTGEPDYTDIGAYEFPHRGGIVVMCWIDEADEAYPFEDGHDLYYSDLTAYRDTINSAGVVIKSGCLAPPADQSGLRGTIADVMPYPEGYSPPPVEISIERCGRPPTKKELIYHFHRIRERSIVPDYVLLLLDYSGSLKKDGDPLDPIGAIKPGYNYFKSWLVGWLEDYGLDYNDVVFEKPFGSSPYTNFERWVKAMDDEVNDILNP